MDPVVNESLECEMDFRDFCVLPIARAD